MGLRVRWVALLGTAFLSAGAWCKKHPAISSPPPRPRKSRPRIGYRNLRDLPRRGVEEVCHQPAHQNGPDARQRQRGTCENCHGAGKAHVDGGGDVAKIFNPAKAHVKEVDAKCLSCHAGTHPNFALPSCQGRSPLRRLPRRPCGGTPNHLLKADQPKLCFQCHKVNEGLGQCSTCHGVHD